MTVTKQQPNSIIKFYSGVPHQDSFAETLCFDSIAEQEAWYEQFHRPEFDMTQEMNRQSFYQRTPEFVRSPFKLEDIIECNYIRVENPSYPGSTAGKTVWWGFVDDVVYSSNMRVEVHWSIDHLQTFMFDYTIVNSYIVQTHLNEYSNARSKNNNYPLPSKSMVNSSAWFSSENVGIDGVSELIDQRRILFNAGDTNDEVAYAVFRIGYDVSSDVVTKYPDGANLLNSDVGTPDQTAALVVPFSLITGLIIPTEVQYSDGSNLWINQDLPTIHPNTRLYDLLTLMSVSQTMTQGAPVATYYTRSIGMPTSYDNVNNILTILPTPNDLEGVFYNYSPPPEATETIPLWKIELLGVKFLTNLHPEQGAPIGDLTPWEFLYQSYIDAPNSELKNIFGPFPPVKIFRPPFFSMKLNNGKGLDYDLDFRLFSESGIDENMLLYRIGSITMSSIMEYFLEYYGTQDKLDQTTYTSNGVVISNNSLISQQTFLGLIEQVDTSFPVYTDALAAYMNANQNQIRVNKKNAEINYQNTKALNNVQLQNLQTTQGANTLIQADNNGVAYANQMLTNNYGVKNFEFSTGKSISQALGSANGMNAQKIMGDAGAIGASAGNIRASQDMGLAQLNNNMQLANATLNIGQAADLSNTQNSVDTSNKVAASQEHMTIAGINAGIQDMGNHAPNAAGHGSAVGHDWAHWNQSLNLQRWRAKEQSIISAMITYQLFGYSLSNWANVTDTINQNKRTKFNFIQTVGANVISNKMNGKWRNMIRVNYDKGLRLWWDAESYATRDIKGNIQVNFDDQ
jgi:hypothetical protein